MTQESDDYQRGYLAARRDNMEDLAAALNARAIDTGDDEPLTPDMAREIFGSVFGTVAADEALGPAPAATDGLETRRAAR